MTQPNSSHFNANGDPQIVDVSQKSVTLRQAVAESWMQLSDAAYSTVQAGTSKKGDVLAVAKLAAIMASKQTSTLIPLCHSIPIDKVDVTFELHNANRLRCIVTVKSTGRTGVEMEALTAASVGVLTVYDMCKGLDKGMEIGPIRLLSKSGGASGTFTRPSE